MYPSTECDLSVRAWATNLEDFDTPCKLVSGDLFAQDAVYDKKCKTLYYTCHRSHLPKRCSEGKVSQSELEGIVLAETVHGIMLLRMTVMAHSTQKSWQICTKLELRDWVA